MNRYVRILCAMFISLLLISCSLGSGLDFVPVDSSKYATPENLQSGLKQAKKECSTIKSRKAQESALNVQKAVFESNVQTQTAYKACMQIRGFVPSNNKPNE